MMSVFNETWLSNPRGDLFGSVTAAIITLPMALAFGVAKAISRKLAILADHQVPIVNFDDLPTLGVPSSLALEKIAYDDLARGCPVFIVGAEGEVKQRLNTLGLLQALPSGHVLETRQAALEVASALLDDKAAEGDSRPGSAERLHGGGLTEKPGQ